MNTRNVYGMILAAGQSRRMGEPKQLMAYRDGTMLDAVIEAVLESSLDGLCIAANPEVSAYLADQLPERCLVAVNDDPNSEMLVSVQIGLRRIQAEFTPHASDGVMILLGDQPQVGAGTITTCAETYRLPRQPPGILIATYRGQRGHPTIFSAGVLEEILNWSPDRRLNELAQRHPKAVREMAITTCPMPIDVNTPEDFRRLCDRP